MIPVFVLGFERTYSGDVNVILDRDWLKFGDVLWYANAKYTVLSNDGPITEIEGRNVHGTSYKLDQTHVLPVTGEYFVFQSNLPKLVKIDPDNPPEYKKQMLFYNSDYNLFRLGQVRCIQEDENGKSIVYNYFDEVKLVDNTTFQRYTIPFYPTHYLSLDLEQLTKTINNGNN